MIIKFLLISFIPLLCFADVYEDLARATGGTVSRVSKEQFLKNTESGENRYQSMANAVAVISEEIEPKKAKRLTVPIDAETFGGLVVELKGDDTRVVKLTSPQGREIIPAKDSGPVTLPVEIKKPQHRILIVPKPEKGLWKLSILDSSGGMLLVRLQSSLRVDQLSFVEVSGRPGHQGLFPIHGQPKRGTLGILQVRMTPKNPQRLELIDVNGIVLSSAKKFKDREGHTFYADVRIPDVNFRIRIFGESFQRVSQEVFSPQ